ncbi:helicase [Clostridium tyrobutyricum]|uniref:helicase-related protein n=1 Tax=Clostridium tyrobutyricum TaxID=1519 RepID=UPI001C388A61|nr:helicase-related protein [Clostridium tyrobutyricum]MBV4420529.1 helicase [Clostridium tyrobutyricum]
MEHHNDLTFFTNEPDRNLYDRFSKILKSNTKFFDVLVGYFRSSGFYLMYPAMEDIDNIRILVGLNVDGKTIQIIQKSKEEQLSFEMSYKEVKSEFKNNIQDEMENSKDSFKVEQGIKIFIKWLQSGKLQMRIFPESPVHAKVYIMRKDMDKCPDNYGSVITGSSNFSQAGLVNNLEFNVELKDSRDVNFALEKFEELWSRSIDITEEYIETINNDTWIRDNITPYELFLKTLYEYFQQEINEDKNDAWVDMFPENFMKLQYQTDAVIQAKKTLDSYNGVFISDVVGLGKTYICAMLMQRLKGRKLVICPPVLKDYWEKTLHQFEVSAEVESLGKLDYILNDNDIMKNTKYVFIDEAHRFRNGKTESFQKLHEICYNKKVVLVTATPQNNFSTDIANQIYLFQPKNNSTIIPNNKNIEAFFNKLDSKLKHLERGTKEYSDVLKANSEVIRDQVLRNVMIRRTRKEIMEFYKDDLKMQGLRFPQLSTPEKIVYIYKGDIEKVFNYTILIIKSMNYSRYQPLTYLKKIDKDIASQMVSQKNMGGFMKSILIKRLESSFEAFKKTLNRFIKSYEQFIEMSSKGDVYISKKIDVYDLLDNGDDEKLMELVDADRVQHYKADEFRKDFISALKQDLLFLKRLKDQWECIIDDPKKEQFLFELQNNITLKNKKIIIFTESKDTAEYIGLYLEEKYPEKVLVFSGQGSRHERDEIEANFNPNYQGKRKNNIKFLITTDVLAEGINLHRANIIVNYDLPWNPTKVMQRVGRINRVGTEYERIYVFNFFPAAQANAELSIEENIILKIQAFHDTLGEDFKYLSEDEEVSSHKLYQKLNSNNIFDESDIYGESELEYLNLIRKIRDTDEKFFEKIKKLPKKSKSSKKVAIIQNKATLSFLRKGSLKKFYATDGNKIRELTFIEAMKYLKCTNNEEKLKVPEEYFKHLKLNKEKFENIFNEETFVNTVNTTKTGNDAKIIKILKGIFRICKTFTDEQEKKIKRLQELWEDGDIPASISKEVVKVTKGMNDPIKIYYEIENLMPERYFEKRESKQKKNIDGKIEVILSEYLQRSEG